MQNDYDACLPAMRALEAALGAVFDAARVGMAATEIDDVLKQSLSKQGAELLPQTNTPFVVDAKGAPPKLRLDRVPLRRGALWAMDNSVRLDGYCADLGRYGYFGRPPADVEAAHRRVLARQEEIAAEIRPGRDMLEIYEALPHDLPFEVHRIATEPGMPPVCGNAVPGLIRGTEQSHREGLVFEPGQVLCVEIWAGLSGGIEDMYVVEDAGIRRISALPQRIREVPEERP